MKVFINSLLILLFLVFVTVILVVIDILFPYITKPYLMDTIILLLTLIQCIGWAALASYAIRISKN